MYRISSKITARAAMSQLFRLVREATNIYIILPLIGMHKQPGFKLDKYTGCPGVCVQGGRGVPAPVQEAAHQDVLPRPRHPGATIIRQNKM